MSHPVHTFSTTPASQSPSSAPSTPVHLAALRLRNAALLGRRFSGCLQGGQLQTPHFTPHFIGLDTEAERRKFSQRPCLCPLDLKPWFCNWVLSTLSPPGGESQLGFLCLGLCLRPHPSSTGLKSVSQAQLGLAKACPRGTCLSKMARLPATPTGTALFLLLAWPGSRSWSFPV